MNSFIERNIGITVDSRKHTSFTANSELLYFRYDGLIILVMERRIFFYDILFSDAFGKQVCFQDLVGSAGNTQSVPSR